jgi:geranylgeranyl diphosphate synthase, type II
VEPLDEYLRTRRADVDAALDRYLPGPPTCPAVVAEAMRYSVMAGGKRLRPILTLASAEAVAIRRQTPVRHARLLALPAACAIEMIHTYSLIHDDLPAMDDDVLRRGRPTLHVIAGEGMAILAGDGLQAEAFGILARRPTHAEADVAMRQLRTLELVAHAAGPAGMVGGQAIDLAAVRPLSDRSTPPPIDGAALTDMHARKTGALIKASVLAGATMAGAEDADLLALDAYASAIGLAFQIVDDILDVEGAADALGKTAGKDAAAGKPTFPALYGLARSREMAGECLADAQRALDDGRLTESRLGGIAEWVVRRQS